MQSISNENLSIKGFSELVLLLILSVVLIQINSLWGISETSLKREKIAKAVLSERNQNNLSLYDQVKSNTLLTQLPTITSGLKSRLVKPSQIHLVSIEDESKMLNWLYLDSLQKENYPCSITKNSFGTVCSTKSSSLKSSYISLNSTTNIEMLEIKPQSTITFLASLGELNIQTLSINIPGNSGATFFILTAYNKISIEELRGSLPLNTFVLIYSILGPIEIRNLGTLNPCKEGNQAGMVFISPSLKIAGENRDNLILSSNSCLKHFPKELFTSIKLTSIH